MLRALFRHAPIEGALVALATALPVLGQAPHPPSPLAAALELPAPDSSGVAELMEVLDHALAHSRAGEHAQAAERFGAMADLAPTLSEWIPLFQAEAIAELGDTAAVVAHLERLEGSEIDERWGWLPRSRSLEVAGAYARAAGVARAATTNQASANDRSLAWLRVGQLWERAGVSDSARVAFVEAVRLAPRSRHAAEAADALSALGELTGGEAYAVARVRVVQGDWKAALPGLEAAGQLEDLEEEEWQQARLDLGRAYFFTRRYGEAEAAFGAVVADSSVSDPYAARALYFVGRSEYRRGRRAEGRATLEDVARRFPDARAARDALLLLADLDHDAGRIADAERYYEDILDLAPTSTTADLAGMRLGGQRYMDGQLSEAAAIFDRRRAEAGAVASRQQASYWAGLVFEALGRAEVAEARFHEAYVADPLSYYGAQAAARVDAPLLPADLPDGPPTPGRSELEGPLLNAVVRLRVHMKVPTPGSFGFELERIQSHFSARAGGKHALAESLIEGGLPIQGIVMGREIQRESNGWDLRLLRIIYPFPHRSVIVREAARRNVNPYLAAGLIRQESMFDEDIKSRAGAIGMMQVMPATGEELARGVGIKPYSTARLTEAEINVILGMTFLSEMLRRYDGAVLDALVAYNAGPTRIRRWRGMPEYKDQHLFVERIPFRETREYVKVVQQNALIYASLYGCGETGEPCLGMTPSAVLGLVEPTAKTIESLP